MIRKIKLSLFFYSIFFLLSFIFPINTLAYNTVPGPGQNVPYAAYNSQTNQYLLVFGDCRDATADHCVFGSNSKGNIYGQLITADGGCVGNNFFITNTPTGKDHPAVVYNSDRNEFLVVWQGHKYDFEGLDYTHYFNKGYDIWGQRTSASGQRVGEVFRISKLTGGNADTDNDDQQWHPRLAYAPAKSGQPGVYMVVWHDGRTRPLPEYSGDSRDRTTFKDIYGQILSSDGSLIGENFPVSIDPSNTTNVYQGNAKRIQQYSDIAYDSRQDKFIVVWEDDREGTSNNPHPCWQQYDRLNLNIYGGFFDRLGRPQGNNFKISGTAEVERYPRVAFNTDDGDFLIVWQGATKAPFVGATESNCPTTASVADYPVNDYYKVYGQRIGSDGSSVGNRIEFESQAMLHDRYLDESYAPRAGVIYNPETKKYVVTWEKSAGHVISASIVNPSTGTIENKSSIGAIGGNRINSNKKNSGHNYLLSGTAWSENKAIVVFKTSQSGFINCTAGAGAPTATPGGPTRTPTPTQRVTVSPTVAATATPRPSLPPTPTSNPNCLCQNDNCHTSCNFDKFSDITYNSPIRCFVSLVNSSAPSAQDKNNFCRRPFRTKGDANGDGVKDNLDYEFYFNAMFGLPVPANANPDFNGDGVVSVGDLVIFQKN